MFAFNIFTLKESSWKCMSGFTIFISIFSKTSVISGEFHISNIKINSIKLQFVFISQFVFTDFYIHFTRQVLRWNVVQIHFLLWAKFSWRQWWKHRKLYIYLWPDRQTEAVFVCTLPLYDYISRTFPSVWPVRKNTSLWRRNPMSLWAWLSQEGGAARAASCQSLWPVSNLTAACPGMEESSEVSTSFRNDNNRAEARQEKNITWEPTFLRRLSFRRCPAEYQRPGLNISESQWGCRHLESQRCLALGPAAGAGGQHGGRPWPRRASASHTRQWLWCQLVPVMGHVAGITQVSPPRKGRLIEFCHDVLLCVMLHFELEFRADWLFECLERY